MNKNYLIGVDLGGTTTKIGFFTRDGILVRKYEIPTRTSSGGEMIIEDICESIELTLRGLGIAKNEVIGVGIGVPGAVKNEAYVEPCVNLNAWGGFDAASAFSKELGFPVKVGNDANVAALGEMWKGGGEGSKNLLFVTLGTGVGAGIIVDGKLLCGTHGAAGEIGHMKVNPHETETCGCGKNGCLEQYVSATGLVNSCHKLLSGSNVRTSLHNLREITCEAVFCAAKDGDDVAKQLLEKWGKVFGMALANVSSVYDPEIIVVGGGVSKAGNVVIKLAEKYFVSYAFPASEKTRFALACLGNDAGIYGGAKLALELAN